MNWGIGFLKFLVHRKRRIKILYRKNLKMSPGKLAAQAVHAALGLPGANPFLAVVVLAASDVKFDQYKNLRADAYVVRDAGRTEVAPGTETCIAFYENEETPSEPVPAE